jgi:hypothetical protein
VTETEMPDFADKVVVLYAGPIGKGMSLQSPSFETQAGRLFLIGDVVDTRERDWTAGSNGAVAWDQV